MPPEGRARRGPRAAGPLRGSGGLSWSVSGPETQPGQTCSPLGLGTVTRNVAINGPMPLTHHRPRSDMIVTYEQAVTTVRRYQPPSLRLPEHRQPLGDAVPRPRAATLPGASGAEAVTWP